MRSLLTGLLIGIVALPAAVTAQQRCAVGRLSGDMIEDYPVVIAGKVLAQEDSEQMGGFALSSWVKNRVHVLKSWKGPDKGERIAVHRNVRWGDGLGKDSSYVIFAKYEDDDEPDSPLIAPVCSHTKSLDGAGRLVKALNTYFERKNRRGVQLTPGSTTVPRE